MPPPNASFLYPQLHAGVDGIRILTIEPGDFLDDLRGTLTPVVFGSRPKYVALSYTWGTSYPENASHPPRDNSRSPQPPAARQQTDQTDPSSPHLRLPQYLPRQRTVSMQSTAIKTSSVTVNNRPFEVGYNLYLALLHLRSPTHPISVWADAICINQFDSKERNQQVSLMAFIYTRAKMVVAWLGPKKYRDMGHGTTALRPMSLDWKSGQAQYFAAAVAGDGKIRCSPKPNLGVFVRITESTYWTRLWIVQEVCLPRSIVFVYGSDIWTYDEFQSWDHLFGAADVNRLEPMRRLMASRAGRHSDMMTLERVIERFARHECTELRDRVYGLLGCAHDIDAFATQDDSELESPLAEHIDSLTLDGTARGRGKLRVDYSRSFYDTWSDVVEVVYSNGKTTKLNIPVRVKDESHGKPTGGQEDVLPVEMRLVSIVRAAGIVQHAFGEAVEAELNCARSDGALETQFGATNIRAVGYIAGQILELGPDCRSLFASSRAQQEWMSCWANHYSNPEDMEELRRIDEGYVAKILDWEDPDINRIRVIRNPEVRAWPANRNALECPALHLTDIGTDGIYEQGREEPRVFLGTGYVMGLVPQAAEPGDVIVRFWNCGAAMVMRPMKTPSGTTVFLLIGRADAAEAQDSRERNSDIARDQEEAARWFGSATCFPLGNDVEHKEPVFVDFDLATLQIITAHVSGSGT